MLFGAAKLVLVSLFLGSRALEHFASLHLKIKGHVALQIADPFVVAFKEGTIFIGSRGKRIESCSGVALLVANEVLSHMVAHKRIEQVQLEIILLVELVALHGLCVCVVIALVAAIRQSSQKLLLALKS